VKELKQYLQKKDWGIDKFRLSIYKIRKYLLHYCPIGCIDWAK
jgi:hypothetical protein